MSGLKMGELFALVAVSLLVRFLLVPAYFSTDFDVHMNWLRITHHYPLKEWYTNTDSIWTLDYPPLFAFFEYLLTLPASIFCPAILVDNSQGCHSRSCIFFHRLTVIASEFVFLWAVLTATKNNLRRTMIVFLQFGFILLDDIHFQYNSFMQGLLIFSVHYMLQGQILRSAFIFAWLLNMKHIYLYVAPIYFFYILNTYVFKGANIVEAAKRLAKVGGIVLVPFTLSLVPFVWVGGLEQLGFILGRLFPFQRGLVHSYWAPNFWALYFFVDRIVSSLTGRSILATTTPVGSYSATLKILYLPTPTHTLLLILVLSFPLYLKCLLSKSTDKYVFPRYMIISGLIFCFFGYHVHQKAITVYINLALLFLGEQYWREALVNSINLMPLLINVKQKLIKAALCLLYSSFWGEKYRRQLLTRLAIVTGVGIYVFHQVVHPMSRRLASLEFLPLMLNSVWAACFNALTILKLYPSIFASKQTISSAAGYQQQSDRLVSGQNKQGQQSF